eukprot:SAG31_NODE_1640_length_7666_cov_11.488437_8_plen_51_part_00
MTILERFSTDSPLEVQTKEQFWIDKLKPSLNMRNAKKQPAAKEFDFGLNK